MKKIKVLPIFGGHQIYQEIVNFPPENIEYVGVGEETKQGRYYQNKKIKEKLGRALQTLSIPRMLLVKPGNYDIVHSSRGIIPLTNKPWVMDIEHVHSFFGLNPKRIKNKFWKRFIENKLASKNCKAILCHCEATRQSFFYYLNCSKFKDKLRVLSPASHIINIKKEKHKKIRILAVISIFNNKSGPQILKAFKILEKKYKNIELWIKADVPAELKNTFISKNIQFIPYFENIIPREKLLQDLYSKCDIFLYPSLTDSFGYSLIDAMVAKLPIVSTNLFAFPEIVKENKNGFIIKIPNYNLEKGYVQTYYWKKLTGKDEQLFVEEIVNKVSKLINNKKLREKMGKASFEKVLSGNFSIKERNNQLKNIYEEALK